MIVAASRGFRRLAVAATAATYLLIVAGGVVRVTGSGLGCGETDDWPLCHGALLPPAQQTAIIEFSHRWLAFIATTLVVTLAAAIWLRHRQQRRLVVAATAVVGLFVLQIALGAITVKYKLPNGVIMLHLANALLLLGALTWIAVNVLRRDTAHVRPAARVLRLGSLAAAATYVLALSGALVVDQGAGYACDGWPLCGGGFQLSTNQLASVNLVHRVVAGAVVLLLGYVMVKLRRAAPSDRALRGATRAVMLLMVAQVAAGALVVELRLPAAVRAVHIALASALWAAVVASVVLTRGTAESQTAAPLPRETARVRAAV